MIKKRVENISKTINFLLDYRDQTYHNLGLIDKLAERQPGTLLLAMVNVAV